ncbi:MAG: glutathione S-transferase N-terminal domain-containing protein [Hyphomicrobiaceae bacterium]
MIDLYFWTTPNGMKPLILLEETGLEHTIQPVNISKGAQFSEAFTRISPNQKIPAIVDHAPRNNDAPIALFESGAILQYLAEKAQIFLPESQAHRAEVMQWLFWQMAGLGPTLGQFLHFANYSAETVPYAQGRFSGEKERLYQVLNDRLRDRDFIAGDYSIADMAAFPWIHRLEREGDYLNGFADLQRWHDTISRRPAVERAYARAAEINTTPTITEESRKVLFGVGPLTEGITS